MRIRKHFGFMLELHYTKTQTLGAGRPQSFDFIRPAPSSTLILRWLLYFDQRGPNSFLWVGQAQSFLRIDKYCNFVKFFGLMETKIIFFRQCHLWAIGLPQLELLYLLWQQRKNLQSTWLVMLGMFLRSVPKKKYIFWWKSYFTKSTPIFFKL